MFIDEGVVRVRAGNGGNGCASFRREKFVPRGGPDGGDGGRGGSIYFRGDRRLSSLNDVTSQSTYTAEEGGNGGPNKRSGRAAKDVSIRVPLGTVVREILESGELSETPMVDILSDGESILVARGGRGGAGNARLVSAKLKLPMFALRGAPGERRKLHLSLKLLSDIAIVGLPNSGKSTLLSKITAARPKIADYPFTTLSPNLGVLNAGDTRIVLADIPGLVKDAHAGKGLGNRFLKHIERAAAILILLDAARPVEEDYQLLREEILQFNPEIWERPRVVAVNKLDLTTRFPIKKWSRKIGEDLAGVSAKNGVGIEKLLKRIETLQTHLARDTGSTPQVLNLDRDSSRVVALAGGSFRLVSAEWEELAAMLPGQHRESRQWFVSKLRAAGIFRLAGECGAKTGDVIRVGDLEIEHEE